MAAIFSMFILVIWRTRDELEYYIVGHTVVWLYAIKLSLHKSSKYISENIGNLRVNHNVSL